MPSEAVLCAFNCGCSPEPLSGAVWRSGDVVLKPAFNSADPAWEATVQLGLPCVWYRIAEPLRTKSGDWVCDGWTAQRFVTGVAPLGSHIETRFTAARVLHRDLHEVTAPAHLSRATDPWALADRIAFGKFGWDPDPRIAQCLTKLRRGPMPITEWQIIHGDLAGNFLVAENIPPAIIDFTPKWSPNGFGEAIMAVDICLWEGVPFERVKALLTAEERLLLPLATTRRLLEVDTRHRARMLDETAFDQVSAYEKLADKLVEFGL